MNSPLYRQIYLDLKQQIFDGTYAQGERLPSENDLSNSYDVSRITAKRALTELEADGYCYRVQGRGTFVQSKLATPPNESSNFVLLILPFGSNIETGDYTLGMQPVFKQAGLELFITTSDFFENKKAEEIIQTYCGLIYYPQDSTDHLDVLYELAMQQFPIVLLDKTIQDFDVPTVSSNNIKGSYLATQHLIELGHKQIGFVYNGQERLIQPIRQRYFGYLNALSKANITYRTSLEQSGKLLLNLVDEIEQERLTAVVCENDITAIKIIQVLEEANVQIPDEFSIIGFDDIQVASLLSPSLTTVAQNFREIGRIASETLLKKIKDPHTHSKHIIIETELILRDTTSKRPK